MATEVLDILRERQAPQEEVKERTESLIRNVLGLLVEKGKRFSRSEMVVGSYYMDVPSRMMDVPYVEYTGKISTNEGSVPCSSSVSWVSIENLKFLLEKKDMHQADDYFNSSALGNIHISINVSNEKNIVGIYFFRGKLYIVKVLEKNVYDMFQWRDFSPNQIAFLRSLNKWVEDERKVPSVT